MKSFLKWAESNKLDLPLVDAPASEKNDTAVAAKSTDENTKRSGISQNYPDAYVRAQYPHKYFNPVTSTADGKLTGKMG